MPISTIPIISNKPKKIAPAIVSRIPAPNIVSGTDSSTFPIFNFINKFSYLNIKTFLSSNLIYFLAGVSKPHMPPSNAPAPIRTSIFPITSDQPHIIVQSVIQSPIIKKIIPTKIAPTNILGFSLILDTTIISLLKRTKNSEILGFGHDCDPRRSYTGTRTH